jgi:uncharacterized RDD family membrane protein YckC
MNTPESNRFAPPNAQVTEPMPLDDAPVLASRWARFGAAFIDGLFQGVLFIAVLAPLYGWSSLTMAGRSPLHFAGGLAVTYIVCFCIQAWFLYDSSQTLGKKALGLRIVRPDGAYASFPRLLARLAIMMLSNFVPYLGRVFGLVDVLFIFGAPRRCLHDFIVDTAVVTAASAPYATRQGADGVHLRTANF